MKANLIGPFGGRGRTTVRDAALAGEFQQIDLFWVYEAYSPDVTFVSGVYLYVGF